MPHVLALTASLVTKKIKSKDEFKRKKNELEEILDSKVITTENLANLLKFATKPTESTRTYGALAVQPKVSEIIKEGTKALDLLKTDRSMEIDNNLKGADAGIAIQDAEKQCKKFNRILAQTDKVLKGNYSLVSSC